MGGGGRGRGWVGGGGCSGDQGGCERKIEVFVKIQEKIWGGGRGGGSGWGVRVDVIKEFKFWGKFTKIIGGGGGSGVGVWVGGSGWWGEGGGVDVNEVLKFL